MVRRSGACRGNSQHEEEADGYSEQEVISIKSYSVVLADGTTGTMSTCFLDAHELIGRKVNIRAKDQNGLPFEKRGELAEILGHLTSGSVYG